MEFMKSTRSIIAILSILLVFVLVFGSIFGATFPNEILMLVGTVVGSVTTAYFGKRDSSEDRFVSPQINSNPIKDSTDGKD